MRSKKLQLARNGSFRAWRIVAPLLVGLAVAAGATAWFLSPPIIAVVAVKQGTVQESIEERGRTRLPKIHEITMPSTARVAKITLEIGDYVRSGEVVARLIDRDLQLELAAVEFAVGELEASLQESMDEGLEQDARVQSKLMAKASKKMVESANARLKESREVLAIVSRLLERTRKLAEEDARTEDDLDRGEAEFIRSQAQFQNNELNAESMRLLDLAAQLMPKLVDDYLARRKLSSAVVRQQLRAAQVRLDKSRLLMERATMRSPVDGVVLYRAISSERLLSGGATLMRIGDLSQMEVQVDLLTQDATRVPSQAAAGISFGTPFSEQHVQYPAFVFRIEPEGFTKVSSLGVEQQRVRAIVRFAPEAQTEWSERQFGVGFRARVKIVTRERHQVLRIPRTAIFRDSAGAWQVFAWRSGKAMRTNVEIGLANDLWVEITRGLTASDSVVIAPDPELKDGQRIRIKLMESLGLDEGIRVQKTTSKYLESIPEPGVNGSQVPAAHDDSKKNAADSITSPPPN